RPFPSINREKASSGDRTFSGFGGAFAGSAIAGVLRASPAAPAIARNLRRGNWGTARPWLQYWHIDDPPGLRFEADARDASRPRGTQAQTMPGRSQRKTKSDR